MPAATLYPPLLQKTDVRIENLPGNISECMLNCNSDSTFFRWFTFKFFFCVSFGNINPPKCINDKGGRRVLGRPLSEPLLRPSLMKLTACINSLRHCNTEAFGWVFSHQKRSLKSMCPETEILRSVMPTDVNAASALEDDEMNTASSGQNESMSSEYHCNEQDGDSTHRCETT